jgi:DnaJ-class molecular chaperone
MSGTDDLHLADAAPADVPSVTEDICPRCNGDGVVDTDQCPECRGTGRVIRADDGSGRTVS